MDTELHTDDDYYHGESIKDHTLTTITGAETGVDFIYEYSDITFLYTRVKVLSGGYEGLILDYGGSMIAQWEDKNEFSFEYTIFAAPDKLFKMNEAQAKDFKEFLALLLCDVVAARKDDPHEKEKLTNALLKQTALVGQIKINHEFYSR
jgi:hypothetical protein